MTVLLQIWKMEGNHHKAINGTIWIIWDPNIHEVECIKEEAHLSHRHVKEAQGSYRLKVY